MLTEKFHLDELERLTRRAEGIQHKHFFLGYCGALCAAVPELIKKVRVMERMVDMMAEDMGHTSHQDGYYRVCEGCKDKDTFGQGGCGTDCLLSLYARAAEEAVDAGKI